MDKTKRNLVKKSPSTELFVLYCTPLQAFDRLTARKRSSQPCPTKSRTLRRHRLRRTRSGRRSDSPSRRPDWSRSLPKS
jgi:hypothetical protein